MRQLGPWIERLNLLVFGALIYPIQDSNLVVWPMWLGVVIMTQVERHRLWVFAAMNVVSAAWLWPKRGGLDLIPVNILVLAILVGLFALTSRLPRLIAMTVVILISLCAMVVGPTLPALLKTGGFIFALSIFFNAYYFRFTRGWREFNLAEFLCSQPGVFSVHVLPLPPLAHRYLRVRPSLEERLRSQRSGLYWACFLLLLFGARYWILENYESSALIEMIIGPMPEDLANHAGSYRDVLPFTTRWAVTAGSYLTFVANMMIWLGYSMVCFRMIGVELTPPVTALDRSRSLYEFWARSSWYYAQLLLDIFVAPIDRALRFVKNREVRFALAFTAGIAIGGVIVHFTLAYNKVRFFIFNLNESFYGYLPYWPLVAVVTYGSIRWERGNRELSGYRNWLRLALYFAVTGILFVMVRDLFLPPSFGLRARLYFMLSLFGI